MNLLFSRQSMHLSQPIADVRISACLDLQEWERCLLEFSGSPLLSSRFLSALATVERQPVFLRFYDGDECLGLLAGVVAPVGTGLLRRQDACFISFTGAVYRSAVDENCRRACISALLAYGKQMGWYFVDMLAYDHPHAVPSDILPWKHEISEYFLDLQPSPEQLLLGTKPKVRQAYRKLLKSGARFELYEAEDRVSILQDLMSRTKSKRVGRGNTDYQYIGLPGVDFAAVERCCRSGVGAVYLTFTDQDPCVATFVLRTGSRSIELLRGCSQGAYESGANTFAALAVVFLMREQGCSEINTGGVAADPGGDGGQGLTFFKKSLGYQSRACQGGRSAFLQGSLQRLLFQLIR
ncbi:MAG: hypothetical protein DDT26_02475 [Dehalococcoidia bacterium]|nr:hypothetical protein [Chloroflexota bacterium]